MPFSYVVSQDIQLASAQISTQPGGLAGIDIVPPDRGYVIVNVYDSENSDVTGKKLVAAFMCSAGIHSINHNYLHLVNISRGIYVQLTASTVPVAANHYYLVRYAIA